MHVHSRPGSRRRPNKAPAFLQALKLIERDGWCFVTPNHRISYSVGLWANHQMPEIVVIGLPDDSAYDIASATMKHGKKHGLYPGLVIPEAARGRNVRVRAIQHMDVLSEFLNLARVYYEAVMETPLTTIPTYQIEWPDSLGHYPDHPQYHSSRQERP